MFLRDIHSDITCFYSQAERFRRWFVDASILAEYFASEIKMTEIIFDVELCADTAGYGRAGVVGFIFAEASQSSV